MATTTSADAAQPDSPESSPDIKDTRKSRARWNLGMLNDKETDEVPGSVLLLTSSNFPLGLAQTPRRTSTSSLPSAASIMSRKAARIPEKKMTADGTIILEPQPTDSENDPLNWPILRRDLALLSLGLYCFLGGGMTPILAAGFHSVAHDLDVTVPQVALTTGLYMLGLGLGSVILSPSAILWGKRGVYLVSAICFVLANIWCALSPDFGSLLTARVFMGFAVSSVECLPSASIAEIYFLHEKAYRLGIYTLLLLGGKNLIPLVSAVIIQTLGWRWVFWIGAMVVSFAGILLFFFVPETFWDRTPKPRGRSRSLPRLHLFRPASKSPDAICRERVSETRPTIAERRAHSKHAHFASLSPAANEKPPSSVVDAVRDGVDQKDFASEKTLQTGAEQAAMSRHDVQSQAHSAADSAATLTLSTDAGYFMARQIEDNAQSATTPHSLYSHGIASSCTPSPGGNPYTRNMARAPRQSFMQQLRPFSGRINHDNWFKAAIRPFILFAYPSILWSSLTYALSVGWLIVLSESASSIYQNRDTYNFTALQVGLVYIAPFIGGILGTAVAGKVSDVIVRFLARRNGGVYEPEFRLVMTIPIAFTTVIGLMGYGWSAQERDLWIVPTVFFAIISFGCTLGSTTAITFAVDSYRQYAGEALVTLNFSKNILHGLVWSFFFNRWLDEDGSKTVFITIGSIQLVCLLFTIPMYIYGKRGRMWTVRKNLMERF